MPKPVTQFFTTAEGDTVAFRDHNQQVISAKCQPRDIELVGRDPDKNLREAIAIDVRIGQGYPAVGAARGLLWS